MGFAHGPAGANQSTSTAAAVAWVSADELADYPFPGADQRTVELLLKEG